MGGFVFIFILIPLTAILLLIWLISRQKIIGKILMVIWIVIFGLFGLLTIIHPFISPKELKRNDIYGQYVIDRTKFPGKQADWQYNHFRFEITEREFIFYQTEKDKIVKVYKGTVKYLDMYSQPRIVIAVDSPGHHIIDEKPTLYRNIWSFYYVFKSPKFGNVFFTKGLWKPISLNK